MESTDSATLFSAELKKQLDKKDQEIEKLKKLLEQYQESACDQNFLRHEREDFHLASVDPVSRLSKNDIERYSRQLILPEFGVKGQMKLQSTSVLIVGAGGLGCPAAVYLAAAGIGRLGVVDYDEVELSNLHRQILHTSDRVGISKSLSIVRSCQRLNSRVEYVPYHLQLSSDNAMDIISRYDIVLDATDNVATRYLLNDACVMAGKPLVSGSALRFEGQLTVYNCSGGPCYRCLFPQPPPPETVTNCAEGGVIGVVPGIIGSMQALEAIKIGSGIGTSYSQRMLLFDALDGTFRCVKLRPRSQACVVCGEQPTVTQLIDYVQFCGAAATDKEQELKVLDKSSRISAKEYHSMLTSGLDHVLLDVRPEVEMDICQLPHPNINIPYATFTKDVQRAASQILDKMEDLKHGYHSNNPQEDQAYRYQQQHKRGLNTEPSDEAWLTNPPAIVCVCRRGNDSQFAVRMLQKEIQARLTRGEADHGGDQGIKIVDIRGGLHAWARHVDDQFPVY
ncbi:adenylyltransferase and sulfurtransferase mocs3 [Plakobranchus ocellatus]|uniref:Adenylyltransferase and sulfurtransferase MOCS3 homolog n=1 Tax=Plakobranchus ocellatus TaxID=259542 RepID=A0AAV4CU09_9GAST|nr:adenylyltransferase and sulfurtransferase mocs3 [Plakobranchus ocellatus]